MGSDGWSAPRTTDPKWPTLGTFLFNIGDCESVTDFYTGEELDATMVRELSAEGAPFSV